MRYADDDDKDRTEELDPMPPASAGSPVDIGVRSPDESFVREGAMLRDRYVLDALLDESGRSLVFAARDLRRDAAAGESPEVAIKILNEEQHHSASAIARLKREFRQTHALRHPGAVRMFDLDCDRGAWFVIMERLHGVSLRSVLERASPGALSPTEALRIAAVCAEVLDEAHRQGTPHGDFKPGNVFLLDDGTVKVLDFGAAPDFGSPRAVHDAAEIAATRIATRAYASPEILDGRVAEPGDDLYSYACVVYEMLAGRHPFDRLPANAARDTGRSPEPLPTLSGEQNAALLQGLAWERVDRPDSAGALLRPLLETSSHVPEPTATNVPEPAVPAAPEATAPVPGENSGAARDETPAGVAAEPPASGFTSSRPAIRPRRVELAAPAAGSLTATTRNDLPAPYVVEMPPLPTEPKRPQSWVSTALVIIVLAAAFTILNVRREQSRAKAPSSATPVVPAPTALAPDALPDVSQALAAPSDNPPAEAPTTIDAASVATEGATAPEVVIAPAPTPRVAAPVTPRPASTAPTMQATEPLPPARDEPRIFIDDPVLVVREYVPVVAIVLRREGDRSTALSVTWRLVDGSARAGEDFGGPTQGTLRFRAGETSRTLYVPVVDDDQRELDEFFTLVLESNTAISPGRSLTITIRDDD